MKKTLLALSLSAVCILGIAMPSHHGALTQLPAVEAKMLFTQMADKATLTPVAGHPNMAVLTLHHVGRDTTWFTDRPHRYAGVMRTAEFAHRWQAGAWHFVKNHPNANLVATEGLDHSSVYTISHPHYDHHDHSLTYRVRAIGHTQIAHHKLVLHDVALFVDSANSRCIPGFGCV